MSSKIFYIPIVVFSLVIVQICWGQPSLGKTQGSQVLRKVLESLAADNSTNTTSWGNETVQAALGNETVLATSSKGTVPANFGNETAQATGSPDILSAVIGIMWRSRGHDVGLEANSEGGDQSSLIDSFDASTIAERVWGEVQNSSESVNNTSHPVFTEEPMPSSTTFGLPESTENRHSSEPDTSSLPQGPDLEVSHSSPAHPDAAPIPGNDEEIGHDANPKKKHVDEPVEVATDGEGESSGSLPLVLGVCIVVIFVGGVTGAAISSQCRRRKMAAKDTASESSSNSEIEVERGLDNPAFSKSTSNLTLVASAFPPNSRLHKEMRYASPTMPLY